LASPPVLLTLIVYCGWTSSRRCEGIYQWIPYLSGVYILASEWRRRETHQALPPYPVADRRDDLFLVLGEQHHAATPRRAPAPRWLTIPERGLYTGMAIVGAVGTGKTTACMYPYVEQLLAYRASDHGRKIGGLILEVKGDFCQHVRDILVRHGRGDDYVEVSLTSKYRYNPLHNELDAYALAYGIATLMTNLFGRGKEPFWQQASTNLVKFVILLHQTLDDYVTLFQVYEHVINPDKLRAKIADGEVRFAARNRRIVTDKREHLFTADSQPGAGMMASLGRRPGRTGTQTSRRRSSPAKSRTASSTRMHPRQR
jgi:hypothetical protein